MDFCNKLVFVPPLQPSQMFAYKAGAYPFWGLVENNPSNIRIFPTDICI